MRQKKRIFIYILIGAAFVILGSMYIIAEQREGFDNARKHIELGMVYLSELSYEKAAVEFTEAIKVDPMDADAYLGLAQAYAAMGDIAGAADVLERGFEKTGDIRLKNMLEDLLTDDVTENEIAIKTVSEAVTESESEKDPTTSDVMIEKNSKGKFYPYMTFDDNAYYTIAVISNNEAHIEIFSEIINDEAATGYNDQIMDNTALMVCVLTLDNVEIGVLAWNAHWCERWTWSDAHPQIFLVDDSGGHDIGLGYTGDEPYHIYGEVDTSRNKLSLDVLLPGDIDFGFYDYSSVDLSVGIAE